MFDYKTELELEMGRLSRRCEELRDILTEEMIAIISDHNVRQYSPDVKQLSAVKKVIAEGLKSEVKNLQQLKDDIAKYERELNIAKRQFSESKTAISSLTEAFNKE